MASPTMPARLRPEMSAADRIDGARMASRRFLLPGGRRLARSRVSTPDRVGGFAVTRWRRRPARSSSRHRDLAGYRAATGELAILPPPPPIQGRVESDDEQPEEVQPWTLAGADHDVG